jgi:hypothetical protein
MKEYTRKKLVHLYPAKKGNSSPPVQGLVSCSSQQQGWNAYPPPKKSELSFYQSLLSLCSKPTHDYTHVAF